MRRLKNPMANALYVAVITTICAAMLIVCSVFATRFNSLLSDSW